jgi:hypothetical protein
MIDVALSGHRQFGTPLPKSLDNVLAKNQPWCDKILGHK